MAPSVLDTDAYKFSMAEAGGALRRETFHYAHRRGGPHILSFDVEEEVRALLPGALQPDDDAFLMDQGYHLGGAVRAAFAQGEITIDALPRGSWFFDREPAFSITGPSALVSWLEPLVLQLRYRIQIATLALRDPGALPHAVARVTCDAQRDIVRETLDRARVPAPPIQVDSDGYRRSVAERVRALIAIVGDPERLFEVGLRSATCREQHEIVLQACEQAGLGSTSNVGLARAMGLRAVGTMGHEHVQRFGTDERAFRAMRDRHAGPTSFLLDTYSTVHSGLPIALDLIAEDDRRGDAMRFDSGDKASQFLIATSMARARGLVARFVLEDGFNADLTRRFEELRRIQGLEPEHVMYGYGGYIVNDSDDPLGRDHVAAVYKLSQSGPAPTMKFGDAPDGGKSSIPGCPVLVRAFDGARWTGEVFQRGEPIPRDAVALTGVDALPPRLRFSPSEAAEFAAAQGPRPTYSAATRRLVEQLTADRSQAMTLAWR